MRDFTTNNYCDFLWISDLLQLKKNSRNTFTTHVKEKKYVNVVDVRNVIIFGTIIGVRPLGSNGCLYQIDDGTGVITCKYNQTQFEELISSIEREQSNTLNETLELKQSLERSLLTDVSADDSIFNDRSMQIDEVNINKQGRLRGLKTIWDDIYVTFNSLIEHYKIGDSVIIYGRLYNYFNVNQIYVNTIRAMDISEEITKLSVKLEDNRDESQNQDQGPSTSTGRRFSGLVTFDNVQKLNPTFSLPANVSTPKGKDEQINAIRVVTPHLDTNITFDTFLK